MEAYDEKDVLGRYIFNNYSRYLTDFEVRVWNAAIADEKRQDRDRRDADRELSDEARGIRDRFLGRGRESDPKVLAELERDFGEFRFEAAQRVMADNPGDIFVNRCAECQRVVRTPDARQCFWCGHDWHD